MFALIFESYGTQLCLDFAVIFHIIYNNCWIYYNTSSCQKCKSVCYDTKTRLIITQCVATYYFATN